MNSSLRSLRVTNSIILGAGLLLVLVAGGAVVLAPDLLTLALVGVLGAFGFYKLLALRSDQWWLVWLGVVALSAFGPFLDVVTRQPINWAIGLFVFALCAAMLLRLLVSKPLAIPQQTIPLLGLAYGIYLLYLVLQSLRPEVNTTSALLSLRAPLTGFAAYLLTLYAFRGLVTRDQVTRRVRAFLLVCIGIGFVVGVYGVFQYVMGYDRLAALGLIDFGGLALHNQRNLDGGTTVFRIFSTLRRNETLGVFMYLNVLASTLALRLGVQPRRFLWLNLGLALIVMLLALSLTSIIVLLLWFALVILSSRSKRLLARMLLLVIGGLALFAGVNQVMGGLPLVRVQEHLLDSSEGIGRLQLARNWIDELAERDAPPLLLGSGICTGLEEESLDRIVGILGQLGLRPSGGSSCGWTREIHDNWFATHSLEVGLVGLALYWLIFVALAFERLPRLARGWQEPARAGWVMFGLGLFALWFSGYVGALLLYMPITLYFWSFMALLEVAARFRPAPPLPT